MRVVVGVAEEYWDVSRMSQALRIDPTMIETYSAMLFIDRSELFGAETPNNAFVPLEAGGQAVAIPERIGADASDRFNVDFYVDGQPIGGFEFAEEGLRARRAHRSQLPRHEHSGARTCGQIMTAPTR